MISDILFEDDSIILVHKKAGIAVSTKKITQIDLESMLKSRDKSLCFLSPINRLDQPVEGIVLFAKNKRAASFLSNELQKGNFSKEYLALCLGKFENKKGELENYLVKDGKNNTSFVSDKNNKNAKKALLKYEVLKEFDNFNKDLFDASLVKIKLITGRHHQIRVQFANISHPLLGDKKYNTLSEDNYHFPALCAVSLSFKHPVTNKTMSFSIKPENELFLKV
ncbi:23S rRNA pseudouridine1911/1915/1917 synthase [Acetitomaculum ruminis DSM 5522]|uniref:RNA pseudouridylate synthase n=1 Tax=Acetitomaculum ruminis DSM 5522 TaxID=1120918 RepID=A0A1I0W2M6_9FIRM|nr:RluA family pseudouridine synthase [Acetitomaculum ruminis]SFA82804.1 23S rRNA pseudouridine1911/1915/1917 synthase [Acetitomaculum ruminis DSM 5522]